MKISEFFKIIRGSIKAGGLSNLLGAFCNLKLEPAKMSSFPLMVQIEPTLHCNLECLMCVNSASLRQKKHLSFMDFKKIVDGLPLLKKISLVGAGEPLMNPELFEMVKYAKSRGILIGFATNGILLNELNAKKILASGLDWLNISIDSADPQRYEAIRKGAKFEVVTGNLKKFMEMKGGAPLPEVSVWLVMMRENIQDLAGVVKLSKELGVEKVSVQLEHNWGDAKIKIRQAGRHADLFYGQIKAVLKQAANLAARLGVSFSFVNMPEPGAARSCKWPWKSCYITAEGFITPCCLQGADPQIINFGNLFSQDFSVIWNSQAYRDFRKALRSKEPPAICLNCTAYSRGIKL